MRICGKAKFEYVAILARAYLMQHFISMYMGVYLVISCHLLYGI